MTRLANERQRQSLGALLVIAVFACVAPAQSDPSLFSTVINVPPDPVPAWIDSDTQLNLGAGGVIEGDFNAGVSGELRTNIEVNITDGAIDGSLRGYDGSTVNIFGGTIENVSPNAGSVFNVSGGTIGAGVIAAGGSLVNVTGGELGTGLRVRGEVNLSGGTIGGNFQVEFGGVLNLSGGSTGSQGIVGGPGSTINISDGHLGSRFQVRSGAVATVTGGRLGDSFWIRGNGTVEMSGGSFSPGLRIDPGGSLNLHGGEFRLDGVPVTADSLPAYDYLRVLTGVLSDGSPFAVSFRGISISEAPIPPTNPTPIEVLSGSYGKGLREGETLVVDGGTLLGRYTNLGGTINVRSGSVDELLLSFGGLVNISGGEVGENLNARDGAVVNISGGEVGDDLFAMAGSIVNVSGGVVGNDLVAEGGSVVNASGGVLGGGGSGEYVIRDGSVLNVRGGEIVSRVEVDTGSTVNVSAGETSDIAVRSGGALNVTGGAVGGVTVLPGGVADLFGGNVDVNLRTVVGSDVEIYGENFLLNGVAAPIGSPIDVAEQDQLIGVFADGTAFILAGAASNDLRGVVLRQHTSAVPIDSTPRVETNGVLSRGVRPGETLTVDGATLADGYAVAGGVLNHVSGSSGEGLRVAIGEFNLSGGTLASLLALDGAVVNVSDGTISDGLFVTRGGQLNLSGGEINDIGIEEGLVAISNGVANWLRVEGGSASIDGGVFRQRAELFYGHVEVSGGLFEGGVSIKDPLRARVSGGSSTYLEVYGAGTAGVSAGAYANIYLADDSVTTVSGGDLPRIEVIDSETTLNVSGGVLGLVEVEGVANISGGLIEEVRSNSDEGEVHLYVQAFAVDGVPFELTSPGEGLVVAQSTGSLTAVLADGSPIELDLQSLSSLQSLTVTLTSQLAGDYNNDGIVDLADYTVWRDHVGDPAGTLLNDFAGGDIGDAHYQAWAANYGAVWSPDAAAVPEPTGLAALSIAMVVTGQRRRR